MISLTDFKKLLGPLVHKFTDEEIKKIRDLQHQLADVLFDMWLQERNKSTLADGEQLDNMEERDKM